MTPPFINHFQSNLLMKSFFSVNQSYNVNLQGRKRAVQRRIPGLEVFIENHYPNEIRAPLVSYFNRTLSYRVSSGYRLSIFIVYDQFIRNSSKPYTFAFQIIIGMGFPRITVKSSSFIIDIKAMKSNYLLNHGTYMNPTDI